LEDIVLLIQNPATELIIFTHWHALTALGVRFFELR